jgi:phage nucleotide-binding protein
MVATRGLPPEIIDLQDYTESINWLLYGHSGAGKTVIAGKLPGKVLILANEQGTISAKRQGSKAKVWTIRKWEDLAEAYEWLANNDHPFDWVVIDTITQMQYKCIRWIMRTVVAGNPQRDPHIPAQGDHFKWQLAMKEMVTDFNELPVNVLWTAQEMVREDTEGEELVLPLIEGKDYQISAWVCAQMDIVTHLKNLTVKKKAANGAITKTFVRRLTCNESPPIFAKDRFDVLGRTVDNPDIVELLQRIKDTENGRPTSTAARRPAARAGVAAKRTTRKRTSA